MFRKLASAARGRRGLALTTPAACNRGAFALTTAGARRRRALALAPTVVLAGLAALTPASAGAAPATAADAKPVHVLHLASSGRDSYDALRLTKELEQRFVSSPDARLVNSGKSLLELLDEAKCGRIFIKRTIERNGALDDSAERDVDAACLAKVATSLGPSAGGSTAERYVWGWLGREASGQSYAVVHLWQKGQPDRRVRLPFSSDQGARLSERAYLKLWHPTESGDAKLSAATAPPDSTLWIDDKDAGPFAPGLELTLRSGEHVFELRQRAKVVARAKATVPAERAVDVRLEPVVDPPLAAALPASSEPLAPSSISTVEPSRHRSVLPWVAFGVGAAALGGSALFYVLRQGKESDLEKACINGCPPSQQDNVDSSNRYGALAVVFGGVGLAAVGVGVWSLVQSSSSSHAALSTPSPRPRTASGGPFETPTLRYDLLPLPGGGAANLSASF
ncbi:MAG: hypothetical protein MUF34_32060 [Polyangiaceae bacterium]|nr:hypothetical protein [Polyangiaceae bacterium]